MNYFIGVEVCCFIVNVPLFLTNIESSNVCLVILDSILVTFTWIPAAYYILYKDTQYWRTLGHQIESASVLTQDRELDLESSSQPLLSGYL